MATKKPDQTLMVLREIRDELREAKAEIQALKAQGADLNRLRIESEVRLSTALLELRSAVIETRDLVRGIRQDDRIAELESELKAQATRLAALEQKAS
jgi:hypothetical protein